MLCVLAVPGSSALAMFMRAWLGLELCVGHRPNSTAVTLSSKHANAKSGEAVTGARPPAQTEARET